MSTTCSQGKWEDILSIWIALFTALFLFLCFGSLFQAEGGLICVLCTDSLSGKSPLSVPRLPQSSNPGPLPGEGTQPLLDCIIFPFNREKNAESRYCLMVGAYWPRGPSCRQHFTAGGGGWTSETSSALVGTKRTALSSVVESRSV